MTETQVQHDSPDFDDEHEEHADIRVYTIIFLVLVGLLVLTVIAGLLDLGRINVIIALTIASVKAVLVVLYFMHVKYGGRLVWVFSAAAFLWLGILLAYTFGDYATRGWVPRRLPGQPIAGAVRADESLAERAPGASPQMVRNPLVVPQPHKSPAATTQPTTAQPRVHD